MSAYPPAWAGGAGANLSYAIVAIERRTQNPYAQAALKHLLDDVAGCSTPIT